jgi:GT2 family glycosyltransferase
MLQPPEVTVLVVTYRGRDFIGDCLTSLAGQTVPHAVLVIDNHSTDGTTELLAEGFPEVQVHRTERNLGFAGGLAIGLEQIDTRWCALLNDDAVADPGWLAELLTVAADSGAVAVTSELLLLEEPNRINNLGVALTRDGYGYDIGLGAPVETGFTVPTEVFGFCGGAALIDSTAVRAVGGAPSEFFLYYEDTDISWRLRLAGGTIVSAPHAVVHHRHSATAGQRTALFHRCNERNRLLMLVRCAPLRFAGWQLVRFLLTTASLAAKTLLLRPVSPGLNLRPLFRLKVLAEIARSLPAALAQRRQIGRLARLDRGEVADHWLGRDPYSNSSGC